MQKKKRAPHIVSEREAVTGPSQGPLALGLQWTSRNTVHSPVSDTRGEHRAPHVQEIYIAINKIG